jgi:hypothetical protein
MKYKLIGILIGLSISGIIGAFAWPYTINTWLIFAGKTAVVKWGHGFLMGYVPFLGQFAIPCVVLTWIIMLFL